MLGGWGAPVGRTTGSLVSDFVARELERREVGQRGQRAGSLGSDTVAGEIQQGEIDKT